LTGHIGNWDLLGVYLSAAGYPVSVAGRPLCDPRLDRLLVETRRRSGLRNIARRGRCSLCVLYFLLRSVLFAVLLSLGCGEKKNASAPGSSERELPDQESWDSQVKVWNLGEPLAVIRAGHVRTYEKKGLIEIDEGLCIDFFGEDGGPVARLTAERGTMDEGTMNVTAAGRVVVISEQGDTLRTDLLRWANAQGKIYGDGTVEIATKVVVETGVGLEASPDLRSWTMRKILGRVRREEDVSKE